MTTLCRHLELLGLFRRNAKSDVPDVALSLHEQLNQHGMLYELKIHAFEMHPVWFGSDSKNCTAPVANPRSSRSTAEAMELSTTTPVHTPGPQLLMACRPLR